MLAPPRRHSWLTALERFGAHGDLHAVFDTDPPQDIVDEMDDPDDVLASDLWQNEDFITALRRRRGSRSGFSDSSGVWSRSRQRGRYGSQQDMMNGFRRRSTRDELVGTEPDGSEA